MNTDESYTVHIQKYQETVTVTVQALSYQVYPWLTIVKKSVTLIKTYKQNFLAASE